MNNQKKFKNLQALQRQPHSKNVVIADTYDLKAFNRLKGQAVKLQELEETGRKEFPTFLSLMQDVYSSLYKASPELRKAGAVAKSHRLNRTLIEQMMKTSEYAELRTYTTLDEFSSAIATLSLAQSTLALVPEEIKEKAQKLNELESQVNDLSDQVAGAENILSEANASGSASGQEIEDLKAQANETQMSLDEAKAKLDELIQGFEKDIADQIPALRGGMRNATKETIKEVEETSEFLESWGHEAGSIEQLPVDEKIRRANELLSSDKLRQLAKLVGRFKRLALSTQKTKVRRVPSEVYDVVRGSGLDRVLPAELNALAHPAMKLDFYRRYAEGNLLLFEKKGKEKAGKGPIICCIDNSESMEGKKELWSKAVALALLDIAKTQKRNFACIHFGSANEPIKLIEVPKGQASFEQAIEIGSYFLNGGTDFMKPLAEATNLIDRQEFKRADIVFITDGECSVTDEFLEDFKEVKKQKEFKVISILCDMGSTTPTAVAEFSDDVTFVSEMTVQEAGEIFGKI